jgi:uncharacterized protein (TIGR02118 family)
VLTLPVFKRSRSRHYDHIRRIQMVRFCVFYYGKPGAPGAFDSSHWDRHRPRVACRRRIRRIAVSKGHPGGELYQMAELHFDNLDDLEAALRSPERAVAYEDGQKLPRFVGEIRRQTFDVLDYVKG